jgi:hypothetical protein
MIQDSVISTESSWSSDKINNLLNELGGALHYKGKIKYGADTVSTMNLIPTISSNYNLSIGDICGCNDTQRSYKWEIPESESVPSWVIQEHNPDALGDMYLIEHWYGTKDGIQHQGEVQAQIICVSLSPDTLFDLFVDTDIIPPGVRIQEAIDVSVSASDLQSYINNLGRYLAEDCKITVTDATMSDALVISGFQGYGILTIDFTAVSNPTGITFKDNYSINITGYNPTSNHTVNIAGGLVVFSGSTNIYTLGLHAGNINFSSTSAGTAIIKTFRQGSVSLNGSINLTLDSSITITSGILYVSDSYTGTLTDSIADSRVPIIDSRTSHSQDSFIRKDRDYGSLKSPSIELPVHKYFDTTAEYEAAISTLPEGTISTVLDQNPAFNLFPTPDFANKGPNLVSYQASNTGTSVVRTITVMETGYLMFGGYWTVSAGNSYGFVNRNGTNIKQVGLDNLSNRRFWKDYIAVNKGDTVIFSMNGDSATSILLDITECYMRLVPVKFFTILAPQISAEVDGDYSTDEKPVMTLDRTTGQYRQATWIDGSPIFKRSFDGFSIGTVSLPASQSVSIQLKNIFGFPSITIVKDELFISLSNLTDPVKIGSPPTANSAIHGTISTTLIKDGTLVILNTQTSVYSSIDVRLYNTLYYVKGN